MHTVVFVGKMQSGKTSSCNLLVGEKMKKLGKIPEYKIDKDGDLIIPVIENSEVVWGKFDMGRFDYDFRVWCSHNLWNEVKIFNFADSLKIAVNQLFNIPLEKLYGTNDDKNSLTNIINKNLGYTSSDPEDKPLSIREVLIRFAKVCRGADEDCFLNSVMRSINTVQSNLSLIGDCRFPNEIIGMKDFGAKIIKLNRNPIKLKDSSELSMNEISDDFYDLIIPAKKNLEEKNEMILEACKKWGIL